MDRVGVFVLKAFELANVRGGGILVDAFFFSFGGLPAHADGLGFSCHYEGCNHQEIHDQGHSKWIAQGRLDIGHMD